jgi:hypothetical protein
MMMRYSRLGHIHRTRVLQIPIPCLLLTQKLTQLGIRIRARHRKLLIILRIFVQSKPEPTDRNQEFGVSLQVVDFIAVFGEPSRNRTWNLLIKSQILGYPWLPARPVSHST